MVSPAYATVPINKVKIVHMTTSKDVVVDLSEIFIRIVRLSNFRIIIPKTNPRYSLAP